ncbi:hypothetical protein [Polyangium sp. 6x1]|uniref:hypothetical protein n=1 Tax=Polyangium sp. 6x1 TaxID=3042689 RepID=UPI0024822624|nr:hypothetical protein [Polyangium sp. 6x1]MDI1443849.1 hypothetical protein [Polyangium sp. 6x1]
MRVLRQTLQQIPLLSGGQTHDFVSVAEQAGTSIYTLTYAGNLSFRLTYTARALTNAEFSTSGPTGFAQVPTPNLGATVAAMCKWVTDNVLDDYRACLSNKNWQAYVGAHPMDLMRADWDSIPPKLVPGGSHLSIPCYYCGYVLPWWTMQIDHRAPQSRSAPSICKVLRAAEYKVGVQTTTRSNRMATNTFFPKRVKSDHPKEPGEGRKTVTWGARVPGPSSTALSLESICALILLIDVTSDMAPDTFAHHMFNLVPSCQPCNVSKGDRRL